MEMRVLKVPRLSIRLALQDTLLEMGDLVEAVHIQLSDERRELLVFEPSAQDLACESLMVEN